MSKIPCTVGVLTFNSGKTLGRALESVRDFADILVCDGGSNDNTLEVARTFGARVITQDPGFKNADGTLKNYAGVRNQCLDAAKEDWFLYIDSDETIPDGLREEIRVITTAPRDEHAPLIYRVPLGILMDEKPIRYSSNYPGYQMRFFNRGSGARFIRAVHEKVKFDSKIIVGKTTSPWNTHTTRYEWEHYLAETAKHRTTEIRERCRQPFSDYVMLALGRNIRTSLSVFFKACYNYLVHGFKETLPIKGELGRAAAPLIVAWGITACRFGLPGSVLKSQ